LSSATRGDVTGVFETTLTDAELAERDRQTAARREALAAQGLAVTLEARNREQVELEALAGVGVDIDAREHLRAAHRVLAAARDDLARRREVAAAADVHVARCQAAYDAAREEVGRSGRRAAAAIVAQLERGELPQEQGPSPDALAARTELEHAEAARTEVAVLVGTAEAAEAEAEAQVKEAARGVIRLRVAELRAEIDTLNARLEERRSAINSLTPTLTERRWPWPAEAEALLHDPEAALAGAEAA